MDPTTAATLGGLAGLALGGVALYAVRLSDHATTGPEQPAPALAPGVGEVLSVLSSSAIVLDSSDRVVNTSPAAAAQGLVRDQDLVHPELRHLARAVRRDGVIREAELTLRRGIGSGRVVVRARVAPLGIEHVLLLIDDLSEAHRVDDMRRDFLANVSHELKTPVGGISLLAEAIADAHDDPEAVSRFAQRIGTEADRLTHLVRDIVALSRLQGTETVIDNDPVDVTACATEAVERCRLLAEEKQIELVTALEPGSAIHGDAELITTALTNLIGNAVTYSEPGTRVSVAVRHPGEVVEAVVSDQGIGIDAREQDRIFERFYRVDGARSRATGGTGLGLSIVKHVAENHGGQVSVWSSPGQGSTFTLTVPASPDQTLPQ